MRTKWLPLLFVVLAASESARTTVEIQVGPTGEYAIAVNAAVWYRSVDAPLLCDTPLTYHSKQAATGTDAIGPWKGTVVTFTSGSTPVVEHTYKQYTAVPEAAVVTVKYLTNLDTRSICDGGAAGNITYINTVVGAEALALNTTAGGLVNMLRTLTWARGLSMQASTGLASLGTGGIQAGPVISTDPHSETTLVWSTLDSHKVVPQNNNASRYSIGLSGAFKAIAKGFSHSVVLIATSGGPTAAMYAWGAFMQSVAGKPRVSDRTLSYIGYFTECVILCIIVCV